MKKQKVLQNDHYIQHPLYGNQNADKKQFTAYSKILSNYWNFMTHTLIPLKNFSTGCFYIRCKTDTQHIDPIRVVGYLRVIAYDLKKMSPNHELVLSHTYSYCTATGLIPKFWRPTAYSDTNFIKACPTKANVTLSHTYSSSNSNVDTYKWNGHEYTQVHVQYPYTAMSPDPYVPLTELQLKLCMQLEQ